MCYDNITLKKYSKVKVWAKNIIMRKEKLAKIMADNSAFLVQTVPTNIVS